MHHIELLAPARNEACGRRAIDCGADAIYIGAPKFGAREDAGNPLDAIARLCEYAHQYWARVYVTLNTILRDWELEPARRLAWDLYEAGADGLIVQDMGLASSELPPLPLIASTQMDNRSPERVAFLEEIGFRRVILSRELSLDQIRAIRATAPEIELECFVHGALCVSYSGQCYLSYALGGRSANRGACAQPCRRLYALVDARGRRIAEDRHWLSLRDLRLDGDLGALLDAGVTSFKIEGRLKDENYVANIVAHYRRSLDTALAELGMEKNSSGRSTVEFESDPDKTFNRGFTKYFLRGRAGEIASPQTPKMLGEVIGVVESVDGGGVTLDRDAGLAPGDGLCFFDAEEQLRGTSVNASEGSRLRPNSTEGFEPGLTIHRNHDHAYLMRLKRSRNARKIGVTLTLDGDAEGLTLDAADENGVMARAELTGPFETAKKPEAALSALERQLQKTGDSIFNCIELKLILKNSPFIPISSINALRREALERLTAEREKQRPRPDGGLIDNNVPFPDSQLSFEGNVLNARAEAFYRRHGVESIEPAAESGLDLRGRKVMTTKLCVRHELGQCPRDGSPVPLGEPLALIDEDGIRFELRFDCKACEMEVYFPADEPVRDGSGF